MDLVPLCIQKPNECEKVRGPGTNLSYLKSAKKTDARYQALEKVLKRDISDVWKEADQRLYDCAIRGCDKGFERDLPHKNIFGVEKIGGPSVNGFVRKIK